VKKFRNNIEKFAFGLLTLLGVSFLSCVEVEELEPITPLTIWFDAPTEKWEEGLPVGNGSLGAMFYGTPAKEIIGLNEETIWTGGKLYKRDMPKAQKYLSTIRQLIFEGKYVEAEALVEKEILSPRVAPEEHTYQMLANLNISRPGMTNVSNYKRSLDIRTAIASSQFDKDNTTYYQESFSSFPDQVIVLKYSASQAGKINFTAAINRTEQTKIIASENQITFSEHINNGDGVAFYAVLDFELKGGNSTVVDNVLAIQNADEVIIRISAATDYRGENPKKELEKNRVNALKTSFENLRKRHIADYQSLFNRVEFNIANDLKNNLPTNQRLDSIKAGTPDNYITELQYQYGRYLLISSSRPGTLPANLQGIWADGMEPPWNSDYHLNINVQMNYWMAEMTNLAELHEPFLEYIGNLREMGRITAKTVYGARGFTAHHTSTIWHSTAAFGSSRFGMWPMGAAWSCQHLFTHYEYTQDEEYLRNQAYPIMKEAALFMLDFMVPHPKTGLLVSGPSVSPENSFITKEGEKGNIKMITDSTTGLLVFDPESDAGKATVNMGTTMDREIIFELFSNTIKAAEILDIDTGFSDMLQAKMSMMPPLEIGSDGRLMEWVDEFVEPEPGHRHISHLYALHPSNQISKIKTPKLFDAAKKTIDYRLSHGGGHTGWSRAWLINFFARLQDGEAAQEHILKLQQKSTLPNLLDLHPPFQIDGNFGVVSGITEMLMQSQDAEILLLPALPKAWPSGSIKGIVARGGFELDITWVQGKLTALKVKSLLGNDAKLRYGDLYKEYEIKKGEVLVFNDELNQI